MKPWEWIWWWVRLIAVFLATLLIWVGLQALAQEPSKPLPGATGQALTEKPMTERDLLRLQNIEYRRAALESNKALLEVQYQTVLRSLETLQQDRTHLMQQIWQENGLDQSWQADLDKRVFRKGP